MAETVAADITVLSNAKIGSTGVVENIDLPEDICHYLAHLGFLPGTKVEVLRSAPAGDPRVYRLDGVEVGLRRETAQHIFLKITNQNGAAR
jgi:Fe2+ transport system protein FeoA